ncbi:MAG: TIGR04282 family arsenosugar biosynthesis glycosyltransferase [Burkholderiaceae bacterium]
MESPGQSRADELLIVFAREPVLGTVKTRLASASSDVFALQVYERLLVRSLRLASAVCRETPSQTSRRLMIAFDHGGGSSDGAKPAFLGDAAARLGASLWQQPAADLGARMHSAFMAGFAAGAARIVLIGCDAPSLSWRAVSSAFEALHSNRVSLAPTLDGGYCLIGLSEPQIELFIDMQWSQPTVYRNTLARVKYGSVMSLAQQHDVDHLSDWQSWTDHRKRRGLAEAVDWMGGRTD